MSQIEGRDKWPALFGLGQPTHLLPPFSLVDSFASFSSSIRNLPLEPGWRPFHSLASMSQRCVDLVVIDAATTATATTTTATTRKVQEQKVVQFSRATDQITMTRDATAIRHPTPPHSTPSSLFPPPPPTPSHRHPPPNSTPVSPSASAGGPIGFLERTHTHTHTQQENSVKLGKQSLGTGTTR